MPLSSVAISCCKAACEGRSNSRSKRSGLLVRIPCCGFILGILCIFAAFGLLMFADLADEMLSSARRAALKGCEPTKEGAKKTLV